MCDKKLGDGKSADDVPQEDTDEDASTADIPSTLPTTKDKDAVGLQLYSNPVLNDLLAIDPSIPSSTESKSNTGRGTTLIMFANRQLFLIYYVCIAYVMLENFSLIAENVLIYHSVLPAV